MIIPFRFLAIACAIVLAACQTSTGPLAVAETVSMAIPAANAAGKPKVLRHDAEAARLINAYRSRHGLSTVRFDKTLTRTATAHALDLARSGRTGHTGSDGSTPATRAARNGYKYLTLGENASAGRTSLPDVINAWIKSPSHQPNMVLEPATDFGLVHVVAPGTRYTHYWILMVGTRRSAEAAGIPGGKLRNGFSGGFSGPRVAR